MAHATTRDEKADGGQQLLGEPCGSTVALPVEPVVAVRLCTAIHTIRVTSRAATIAPALVRTSVCTSTRSARPRADPEMKKTPPERGFLPTRPERFELPTFGSVDRRSIQLSYGRSR